MPEIIDGFIITRTWTQMGDSFYPAIDAEMVLSDGQRLFQSRTIHRMGVFDKARDARDAALQVEVRGVVCRPDGTAIIIKTDPF